MRSRFQKPSCWDKNLRLVVFEVHVTVFAKLGGYHKTRQMKQKSDKEKNEKVKVECENGVATATSPTWLAGKVNPLAKIIDQLYLAEHGTFKHHESRIRL